MYLWTFVSDGYRFNVVSTVWLLRNLWEKKRKEDNDGLGFGPFGFCLFSGKSREIKLTRIPSLQLNVLFDLRKLNSIPSVLSS